MKATALAAALLISCNVGGGPPDVHHTYAQDGFDTVRIVQLPEGRRVYVLRDQRSGHCFTFMTHANHSELRHVTDDVCGQV